jgi:hypothetical protein
MRISFKIQAYFEKKKKNQIRMKRSTIFLLGAVIFIVFVKSIGAQNNKSDDEDPDTDQDFQQFKKNNGKKYQNKKEEKGKFMNFRRHKSKVNKHNDDFKSGRIGYKKRMNKYSDLPDEQIKSILANLKLPKDFTILDPSLKDDDGDSSVNKRALRNVTKIPDNFG